MIPQSLRALLDETDGRRECEWADRRVWLAREAWGELAVCLQGAQVLHYLPASEATRIDLPASEATRTASEATRDSGGGASSTDGEEALVPGGWLWQRLAKRRR